MPFLPVLKSKPGKPFTLICNAFQGTQPIRYQWFRNGQELQNPDYNSLIFKEIRVEDFGEYSCLAQNAFGSDEQKTRIEIQGKDSIVLSRCFTGFLTDVWRCSFALFPSE